MKRLIICVTVCLFCASIGWAQSGAQGALRLPGISAQTCY